MSDKRTVNKQALKHQVFDAVAQAAVQLNQPAWIIGGWVRDLLLERPSKDVDFVTVGNGIQLAEATAKELDPTPSVNVFKNFGTAQFNFEDYDFEFVGARKESYRSDSRKPSVEDGSLEDDQNRRDFTINALSISLNKDDYGVIYDPFDGLNDLERKIIRTPLNPDITYSDDPLRMLRAIRFATQLNFEIEQGSLEAIKRNKERLEIISKERIADELNKIMMADKPSIGFELLFDTELLEYVIPEMVDLHGVDEIKGQRHKDNFYHTLEVVDNISKTTNNLWLRYAALLHDIGKPRTKKFEDKVGFTFHGHEFLGSKMVPKIFKRLRLPTNDKMKYVQKMVAMSARPIAITNETITDSAIRRLLFDAGNDIEDLMLLCEADVTTKNPQRKKRYLNNFKLVRIKLKEVEEKDHVRNFQPPISGDDVLQTFDIEPGAVIGTVKKAIKEAILEGEIPNEKEAAHAFMLEEGQRLGLKIRK